MSATKIVAAVGGAAVLAGGITVAALRGGDDPTPAKATTSTTVQVTAQASGTTTPSPAVPDDVLKSVLQMTQQLQELANNNGQPRTLTQEEIDAQIKAQLAQLGIKL